MGLIVHNSMRKYEHSSKIDSYFDLACFKETIAVKDILNTIKIACNIRMSDYTAYIL